MNQKSIFHNLCRKLFRPRENIKFKNPALQSIFGDMQPFTKQDEMGIIGFSDNDDVPLADNRNSEGAPLDYTKINESVVEAIKQDFRPMMKRLNEIDYRKNKSTYNPNLVSKMVNVNWQ